MTKTEIIGALAVLYSLIKPQFFKWWNKWSTDSPAIERFLRWITRDKYHKEARRIEFETKEALRKDLINDKIDDLIQELRVKLDLHRVTLSRYEWTGNYTFPEKPEIKDFVNIKVSITNESVGNGIAPIKNEWQNRSAAMFAKAFYMLHYSEKGYITIGPGDDDDLTEAQNIFNVTRSWRFRLGKDVTFFEGMVALSIMYGADTVEFSPEKIKYIRLMVRKIREARNS